MEKVAPAEDIDKAQAKLDASVREVTSLIERFARKEKEPFPISSPVPVKGALSFRTVNLSWWKAPDPLTTLETFPAVWLRLEQNGFCSKVCARRLKQERPNYTAIVGRSTSVRNRTYL